jgi:TetR/AcrR family transcriptional regulator, repressor for uid operon
MTISGRRVRRRRRRCARRRIVRAALTEFAERGYAGATFARIAQRAGLTRSAVNHHFPSKQLLYRAVLADTDASIATALRRPRYPRTGATVLDELSDLFADVVAIGAEPGVSSGFVVASVLDAHRHQGLGTPAYLDAVQARLTAIVQAAVERGELRADTDVAGLVAMLSALLCGVNLSAGAGDPRRVEVIVDLVHRLVVGTLWQIRSHQSPGG